MTNTKFFGRLHILHSIASYVIFLRLQKRETRGGNETIIGEKRGLGDSFCYQKFLIEIETRNCVLFISGFERGIRDKNFRLSRSQTSRLGS